MSDERFDDILLVITVLIFIVFFVFYNQSSMTSDELDSYYEDQDYQSSWKY